MKDFLLIKQKKEKKMDKVMTYLVMIVLIVLLVPFVLAGCILIALGGAVKAFGLLLTFDVYGSKFELRDIRSLLWNNFTMEDHL